MKQFIILAFLATLLFAKNPAPFAAIGDDIYSNVDLIENLVNIQAYPSDKYEIQNYVTDVEYAKKDGFAIEAKDKDANLLEYLKNLRELEKTYKIFLKKVYASFFHSMKSENSVLFSGIINSGLIDTQAHKDKIMAYYMKHQEEVVTEGVIQGYLDSDAKLMSNLNKNKALTKEQRDAARVKRLRAKDKAEQDAREKSLSDEVVQKKIDIRKHQKKELTR